MVRVLHGVRYLVVFVQESRSRVPLFVGERVAIG
jgi:hypothetical protein